jgi:hypothetical protein
LPSMASAPRTWTRCRETSPSVRSLRGPSDTAHV